MFSSIRDDRFGAGGTFDTNNDDDAPTIQPASKGDWAGIYAGPTSSVSLDHAVVSYAGGISLIEGGETRGFVPMPERCWMSTRGLKRSLLAVRSAGSLTLVNAPPRDDPKRIALPARGPWDCETRGPGYWRRMS